MEKKKISPRLVQETEPVVAKRGSKKEQQIAAGPMISSMVGDLRSSQISMRHQQARFSDSVPYHSDAGILQQCVWNG